MADLYEELGVDKGADDKTIKRAYRKRAQKAHPDKGGSDDEMARVNRAYLVLSNPDARERYDRTGQAGEATGPSMEQRAVAELEGLLAKALDDNSGVINVIEWATRTVSGHRAHIDAQMVKVRREIMKLDRKRGKIKRKSAGVNIAERLIERRMQGLNAQIEQMEEMLLVNAEVSRLLEDYEDVDQDPMSDTRQRTAMWTSAFARAFPGPGGPL